MFLEPQTCISRYIKLSKFSFKWPWSQLLGAVAARYHKFKDFDPTSKELVCSAFGKEEPVTAVQREFAHSFTGSHSFTHSETHWGKGRISNLRILVRLICLVWSWTVFGACFQNSSQTSTRRGGFVWNHARNARCTTVSNSVLVKCVTDYRHIQITW